jgi:hypothetical protein
MKHFELAYNAPVDWDRFTPDDIYFKSGILTRELCEEINVIRWKNKRGFMEEYTHGVFIAFNSVKDEFPNMEINIFDRRDGTNHNGHPISKYNYTNNLVYVTSQHYDTEWVKDPSNTTNYGWVQKNKNPIPYPDDSYMMDFHSMMAMNPRSMQEQVEIVFSARKFLVERILEEKREAGEKKALTKVA